MAADDHWDGRERRFSTDHRLVELRGELRQEFRELQASITHLEAEIKRMDVAFGVMRKDFDTHQEAEFQQYASMNTRFLDHLAVYRKHEAVIDSIVREREAKAMFWVGVSQSVVSSGAWAILVGVGAMVWFWVKGNVK